MDGSVVERYLRLGLQVGRHVDGIVDAYFGPPELAAAVEVGLELANLDFSYRDIGRLLDGWQTRLHDADLPQ